MTAIPDAMRRPLSRRGQVYSGWWVVATAGLDLSLGYSPIVVYSFGIFLKPLSGEFHSGRADLSFASSVQGCVVHLASLLMDRGVTSEQGALASSLLGFALLIGRVGCGYSLDRFFAPRVAACFFGAALGMILLWSGSGGSTAYLAAFLVGLGAGAEVDIVAYLTSRYFGLRAFGEIYGYAFAAFALAGGLGPWVMGIGFDRTGSYSAVLVAFFAATLLAVARCADGLGSPRFLFQSGNLDLDLHARICEAGGNHHGCWADFTEVLAQYGPTLRKVDTVG